MTIFLHSMVGIPPLVDLWPILCLQCRRKVKVLLAGHHWCPEQCISVHDYQLLYSCILGSRSERSPASNFHQPRDRLILAVIGTLYMGIFPANVLSLAQNYRRVDVR